MVTSSSLGCSWADRTLLGHDQAPIKSSPLSLVKERHVPRGHEASRLQGQLLHHAHGPDCDTKLDSGPVPTGNAQRIPSAGKRSSSTAILPQLPMEIIATLHV